SGSGKRQAAPTATARRTRGAPEHQHSVGDSSGSQSDPAMTESPPSAQPPGRSPSASLPLTRAHARPGAVAPAAKVRARLDRGTQRGREIALSCDLNALSRNVEEGYRLKRNATGAKSFRVCFPTSSQSGHHTGAGDYHAPWRFRFQGDWEQHGNYRLSPSSM